MKLHKTLILAALFATRALSGMEEVTKHTIQYKGQEFDLTKLRVSPGARDLFAEAVKSGEMSYESFQQILKLQNGKIITCLTTCRDTSEPGHCIVQKSVSFEGENFQYYERDESNPD